MFIRPDDSLKPTMYKVHEGTFVSKYTFEYFSNIYKYIFEKESNEPADKIVLITAHYELQSAVATRECADALPAVWARFFKVSMSYRFGISAADCISRNHLKRWKMKILTFLWDVTRVTSVKFCKSLYYSRAFATRYVYYENIFKPFCE